jgi:hypothetical protein
MKPITLTNTFGNNDINMPNDNSMERDVIRKVKRMTLRLKLWVLIHAKSTIEFTAIKSIKNFGNTLLVSTYLVIKTPNMKTGILSKTIPHHGNKYAR